MQVAALMRATSAARAAAGTQQARLSHAKLPARLLLREDERLARRVAGGGDRAVAAFSERYSEQLYTYCYLLLQDTDGAYRALEATLARALAALRRGEGDGFLRPWLFGIAHDEVTSRAREAARTGGRAAAQAPSSERPAAERARLTALAGDLHALPELQRSALLMRELTGLSHKEIAAALEISPQSVKQAIFHARRALGELDRGRSLACEDVRRAVSHGDGRTVRRRVVRAHLRSCDACAAFAAAIPARRSELQALALPLPAPLVAGLLSGLLGHTAARGTRGIARGLAGKSAGLGLAGKTAVVAAVAVTAGGEVAARVLANPASPAPSAAAAHVASAHADLDASQARPRRLPAPLGRRGSATRERPVRGGEHPDGAREPLAGARVGIPLGASQAVTGRPAEGRQSAREEAAGAAAKRGDGLLTPARASDSPPATPHPSAVTPRHGTLAHRDGARTSGPGRGRREAFGRAGAGARGTRAQGPRGEARDHARPEHTNGLGRGARDQGRPDHSGLDRSRPAPEGAPESNRVARGNAGEAESNDVARGNARAEAHTSQSHVSSESPSQAPRAPASGPSEAQTAPVAGPAPSAGAQPGPAGAPGGGYLLPGAPTTSGGVPARVTASGRAR
jgi:RNA polymerase sigma factor (sigma-70 family)